MKKTLLGIVLSAAMLPLTFAAQANPPASQAGESSTTTTKTKKHTAKKHTKKTKGTKGEAGSTTTPPQK